MNTAHIRGLSRDWRHEAAVLRRRGANPQAEVLESAAEELDRRIEEWEMQTLSVAEAAAESGYSEDHLRELVREGRIVDTRPPASEGRIGIRRCDLPRKPRERGSGDIVSEMLELVQPHPRIGGGR